MRAGSHRIRAVLAAALAAAACARRAPPPPDTLVMGIEQEPQNLDPRHGTDAYSDRIDRILFDGLTRVDPAGRVQPDLAARWSRPDPRTYVFELHRGVTFHDGSPFRAADVAATFASIIDPATASPYRMDFACIERIEALGPYRVRFRLKEPNAPFLNNLSRGILPAGRINDPDFARAPLGTGPFRFVRRDEGRIELAANPAHFRTPPRVRRLIFRVIADDTTRYFQLLRGGVDMIQNALPARRIERLERRGSFQVVRRPGTKYAYLGFNHADAILRRREVRRAIAHAVDVPALIRHKLLGLADPATGLLPPSHWAYEPRVPVYPYDPDRSRRLLDEAGFPDPDGSGPIPRFTLTYKTSTVKERVELARAVSAQLAQVGVAVAIQSLEWGTFYQDIKNGDFQIYALEWVGVSEPDFYYNILHSRMIPPDGYNRGRYANPRVDALVEAGRRGTDEIRRRRIYSEVQRIMAEDEVYINLWHPVNVAAMGPEVRGFEPEPSGSFEPLIATWKEGAGP